MVNYTSIQMNLNGVNCPICTSFGSTEDTEWTEDKESKEFTIIFKILGIITILWNFILIFVHTKTISIMKRILLSLMAMIGVLTLSAQQYRPSDV